MKPADRQNLQKYIEDRSVIEPNSGCWLWLLSDGSHGYPQGSMPDATGQRVSLAHRMSYLAFKGEVPNGYDIDHLCRIKCCVNPDHLEATTKHANRARQNGKNVSAHHTVTDGCTTCGATYRVVGNAIVCPECKSLAQARYKRRKLESA
jgi:predicted Zn-ribbon and HTH transcriptional regulator